jgi:regulatory protein
LATLTLRAYAIRLLARREYARAEFEQRLCARGATADEIRALVEDLIGQGYLSNERYAHAVVRQKASRYSRRRITGALKAQGIDGSAIDAAMNDVGVDDDVTLVALWQRRFGKPPADDREKARQVRYLQARGFSLSAILKLLRNGSV